LLSRFCPLASNKKWNWKIESGLPGRSPERRLVRVAVVEPTTFSFGG